MTALSVSVKIDIHIIEIRERREAPRKRYRQKQNRLFNRGKRFVFDKEEARVSSPNILINFGFGWH